MLLWRKSWKKHLKSITEKGINTSKCFWKFIKPFPTNKDFIGSNDITLVKKNVVITGFFKTTYQPTTYHRPSANRPTDYRLPTNGPPTKCTDQRPTNH